MTGASLAANDLKLLLAEIATARGLLGQLAAEITSVRAEQPAAVSRAVLALLAVDLHSYYTKLESLLERILVSFDGHTPRGEAGHAALLRVASMPVPGIRPAILGPDVRDALDELRKFRQFFRHAYALDLRAEKLERVLQHFASAHPAIDGALQSFVAFVEATIAQLDSVS